MVEKVIILPLESGVRLLFDFKDDVSRKNARHLVTFSPELDLVAVLDTFVDVNVENLALDDSLLAVAFLAAILFSDDLTLTLAVRTDGLEALDHRAHLAHHRLHTRPIAARTRSDRALFTTASFTTRADDRLLESQFRHLAAVDIFQADLVDMVDGPRFLGTLVTHAASEHPTESTSTAEELSKQVLGIHSSTASTALEALLSILIVDLTFLRIRQDFVSVGEFFEFFSGIGVGGIFVYDVNTA